jgi:putative autotransporter adhesin-like protein
MRTITILIPLVVGCQWLGGAEHGSGKPKTEARQVPAFTKLELQGALHADITAGAAQSVEISGDDNLVPLVTTEVKDQRLVIGTRKRVAPKLELLARISAPALAAVSVSGSTAIKLRGVAGDTFDLDTSGSAEIVASGKTHKLRVDVSGSASIDAHELAAEDVTVVVSGSGEIEVAATGVLDVQISGSGRVRYHGTPRELRKVVSGSGTVEASH